jgi:hypothetical protein
VLLTVDGLQLPLYPLLEVVGSVGAGSPWHMVDGRKLNVGGSRIGSVRVTPPTYDTDEPPLVNVKLR